MYGLAFFCVFSSGEEQNWKVKKSNSADEEEEKETEPLIISESE